MILWVACAGCSGEPAEATGSAEGSSEGSDATSGTSTSGAATGSSEETGSSESTGGSFPACGEVPGEWANAPGLPLGPRQENSTIALDGKLLVMGGYENILAAFAQTVEIFDPQTVQWESGATLDEEIHHPNFAAAGGRAFIVGFLRSQDWLSDGRVFELVPESGWTERTEMPAGTGRGGGGVAVVDDIIYVAGGLQNDPAFAGRVPHFSAYDPATDTWTELPPLPTARHHLAAAAADGVIYTVGGRFEGFDSPVDDVEAYDIATGEWSVLEPLPRPRGGLSVAAVRGCIYAIGGEGNTEAANGMFDDNDVYDPATDSWLPLAPMPLARHGTHAAVIDDWIFIPGGGESQGQDAAHHVQVFIPNP